MHFKPRIRLVDNKELLIETSFDNGWVQCIKSCIPLNSRFWDAAVGVWHIKPAYYDAVIEITKRYFGSDILDSTGGVAHPQDHTWREKLEAHENNRASSTQFVWPDLPKTPRATLFVTNDAPDYVIQAAYRALAARNHPDKGGKAEDMQRINAAYEKLKNG
jgi:hypothetical protein